GGSPDSFGRNRSGSRARPGAPGFNVQIVFGPARHPGTLVAVRRTWVPALDSGVAVGHARGRGMRPRVGRPDRVAGWTPIRGESWAGGRGVGWGSDFAERTRSTRFLHTSGRSDPLGPGRFCGTNPIRGAVPTRWEVGFAERTQSASSAQTPQRIASSVPTGRSHRPLCLGAAKSCHSLPPPGLPPVRRPILPNEPNSRGRSAACLGDRPTPAGPGVDSTERTQFGRAQPVRGRECRHRPGDRCHQRRARSLASPTGYARFISGPSAGRRRPGRPGRR
ncbi:MAG: hypothetical protein JWO38_2989, partial [Gemmataceae bacterium]|nr:hypothetical protein [Gemmataceae bacterium]